MVVAFHERLPAEARERRERERAVDPREREVVDARLRFVAAGPHLVVGHRADEHLRAIEPADVAVGRGVERDRDVPLVHVDQAVLVEPVVAPRAVVGHLLLVRRADVEREVAPARPFDARTLRRACRAGSRSCQRCAGSTTWSSTLMIFGSSRHVVRLGSLRVGERIVLMAGVEAAVLAHERGRRGGGCASRRPCARYSSRYQPRRIACVC